ncbi:RNA 2',3'-cyclic phosphodiesterase [Rhodohalobacter mucosus]|uniref:RNA 2',3'-cyclic phosphodiesterase n=1 Tax=Rhodohalobacter mucosus TaxID=2079485 RepID=A0A316TV32_9BACT|nr:RNA 2',3'-cyclic phosphodiesterase [Rhodohalobacter mucosus]PWN07738.1 RNA 2',3'-cyclic phosphodiesterase [Rhodohalobacter mucosus]
MRLFVSIDPPSQIRKQLAAWIPDNSGIKKTAPRNMHLTLLFLGEQSREKSHIICESLQKVRFRSFQMTVQEIGAFPDKRSPAVVWAGAEGTPELFNLQKKIENQLSLFTEPDLRPFRPHITLARVKNPARVTGEDIFSASPAPLSFNVSGFSLKNSVLESSGAVHRVLKKFP